MELKILSGFPGGSDWLGRSPGEGQDDPLQYSCLEGECHGQRSLRGYRPWGLNESDTTEQVTLSLFTKGLSFQHPVRFPSSSPDWRNICNHENQEKEHDCCMKTYSSLCERDQRPHSLSKPARRHWIYVSRAKVPPLERKAKTKRFKRNKKVLLRVMNVEEWRSLIPTNS